MFKAFCAHLRLTLEQLLRRPGATDDGAPADAAAPAAAPAPDAGSSSSDTNLSAAPAAAEAETAAVTVKKEIDPQQRFAPTRWILMCCFEATHGERSMLSDLLPRATIRPARRQGLAVALFARLTGLRCLRPPMRLAASDARALYDEAVVMHRRAGQVGELPSSERKALSRWLLGMPDAIAATVGRLDVGHIAEGVARHHGATHLRADRRRLLAAVDLHAHRRACDHLDGRDAPEY